jgi:hypothetical protein
MLYYNIWQWGVMGWFRSSRRLGSAVALLAILLQLVAGFGHVHAASTHGAAAPSGLSPAADADDHGDADGHHHQPALHERCDLCATLNLGVAAQLPDAPRLRLPHVSALTASPVAADALVAWRHSPAQSRAPPTA